MTFIFSIRLNHHQEYDRWRPDEGDGCGELPLVAPAVASSLLICILSKPQLLHTPLCHLENSRETADCSQT